MRASMMVPMPMVTAWVGTSSILSWKKRRALSRMVCWVSTWLWVRQAREHPGSLKAMWPSEPMPRSWMSTPPAALMASS